MSTLDKLTPGNWLTIITIMITCGFMPIVAIYTDAHLMKAEIKELQVWHAEDVGKLEDHARRFADYKAELEAGDATDKAVNNEVARLREAVAHLQELVFSHQGNKAIHEPAR